MTRIWLLAAAVVGTAGVGSAQLADTFFDAINDPAIGYSTRAPSDPVARLNARLASGEAALRYEDTFGYLRSVLAALDVPVESQMAVFSKTSFQAPIIGPKNPRALFFNDAVAVGFIRGGYVLEAASHDPRQGVIFYALEQRPQERPFFRRADSCLGCHHSYATLGVPGLFMRSVGTTSDGEALPHVANYLTDDRSPIAERWGGWLVTGNAGPNTHMGNTVAASLDGYPTLHSDITALLVFEHQARMINFITRLGWEVRLAESRQRVTDAHVRAMAREFVDELLFAGEAPLKGKIVGSSGFAERFAAAGPRDRQGRTLRQLDLETRLLRYPCSYMIYSDAFDALPTKARDAVYERLWQVLSGEDKGGAYARFTTAGRRAIIDILRDTKRGLPEYFK